MTTMGVNEALSHVLEAAETHLSRGDDDGAFLGMLEKSLTVLRAANLAERDEIIEECAQFVASWRANRFWSMPPAIARDLRALKGGGSK